MFHFPTFPPTALCVQAEVAGHDPGIQGFPIRRSSDQSSFTSSPRLIAGYNVLHRLLVPRHPPIALSSLFKSTKMLASTVKFSKNGRAQPHTNNSRHGLWSAEEYSCQRQPTPQDPTTCSGQPHTQPTFHSHPTGAGCTDDQTYDQLQVNVPLSRCLTGQEHAPWNQRMDHTTRIAQPKGSLERR